VHALTNPTTASATTAAWRRRFARRRGSEAARASNGALVVGEFKSVSRLPTTVCALRMMNSQNLAGFAAMSASDPSALRIGESPGFMGRPRRFPKIWQGSASFEGRRCVSTWVFRIAPKCHDPRPPGASATA
jgi:hypothetical protein